MQIQYNYCSSEQLPTLFPSPARRRMLLLVFPQGLFSSPIVFDPPARSCALRKRSINRSHEPIPSCAVAPSLPGDAKHYEIRSHVACPVTSYLPESASATDHWKHSRCCDRSERRFYP